MENQMQIETLDRASVKTLVDLLNVDLKALGEKYGVALRINGGKLESDAACTLKLEVTKAGTGSVRSQRLAADLLAYGASYLPGIDLEKPFNHSRLGPMKIVGFNARAHRTPIIAETLSGKRYRFEIEQIKHMAARA
jgi:hypothetical protein